MVKTGRVLGRYLVQSGGGSTGHLCVLLSVDNKQQ
jgi:hypothetical protein